MLEAAIVNDSLVVKFVEPAPTSLTILLVDEAVGTRIPVFLPLDGSRSAVHLRTHFAIPIPLRLRNGGVFVLRVEAEADGSIVHTQPLGVYAGKPASILFVPDARDLTDGSRFYRCETIAELLRQSGFACRLASYEELGNIELRSVDLVILSRVAWQSGVRPLFAENVRSRLCILYDTDDLNFLPDLVGETASVRSKILSKEDAIALAKRRLGVIMRSDGFIGSSQLIVAEATKLGLQAIYIPNVIERSVFSSTPISASGPLKLLLMSGTGSHANDFDMIRIPLTRMLITHPDRLSLTLLGGVRPPPAMAKIANVFHRGRVSRDQMFEVISQHDAGIVPLEDTLGNEAKSYLKYLEFSARGRAILVSPRAEFTSAVDHKVTAFICRSADNWADRIGTLLRDRELLRQVGLNAQRDVLLNKSREACAGAIVSALCDAHAAWARRKSVSRWARTLQQSRAA